MRIESIPPKELLNRYTNVKGKASGNENISGVDEAQITEKAKTFSAVLKEVKDSLETRTPEETVRIAEIAQKVKDGTYSVPSRDVAEKILGK